MPPENLAKNHLATLRELARLARFFKPCFWGDGVSKDTRQSLRSARSYDTTRPHAAKMIQDMNSPAQPKPDPLAIPGVVRIRLSETASAALAAVGQGAFIVVCQGSYPDSAGRWVIHAVPIAWQAAKDATAVLLGSHKATRIKAVRISNP